jgi:hypothetical protein
VTAATKAYESTVDMTVASMPSMNRPSAIEGNTSTARAG